MKILVIVLMIVPYLALCVVASIGHLGLCLWHWKRPFKGFLRDLVFFYGRFVREMTILL